MGQQIWDYTHQCDHTELREALNSRRLDSTAAQQSSDNNNSNKIGSEPYLHRNVLIRIKCTLTSRGRSVNIKSASYKVWWKMTCMKFLETKINTNNVFFILQK